MYVLNVIFNLIFLRVAYLRGNTERFYFILMVIGAFLAFNTSETSCLTRKQQR